MLLMKIKRILALAGVVLLAALYISTLVLALIGSKEALKLLVVAVFCTIAVPVMIHLFLMMTNIRKGKNLYDETYDYRDKDNKKEPEKSSEKGEE